MRSNNSAKEESIRLLNKKKNSLVTEETGIEYQFQRTLKKKRSYSIDFSRAGIKKVEAAGFNESSPVTVTAYNREKQGIETCVRIMGKITGKKDNRSMTLALGADIGKLYQLNKEEKSTIEVRQNQIIISLVRESFQYYFVVTPGIDQNKRYIIRRTYSEKSDYENSFGTKEIIVLENLGFEGSSTVTLTAYRKETNEKLGSYGIRLGEKRQAGKKYYIIRLLLPAEIIKKYAIGTSVLVKFAIETKKMTLRLIKPEDPFQEVEDYNYYFIITPLNEQKINQKLLDDINRFYVHYIGYEFEQVGQKVLHYIFPNAEIKIQKELSKEVDGKEIVIRPDATIRKKPITFVDFKKSIGAIRLRTLKYLKIYPHSHLLICVLEEDFGWSWREKHVKNKLTKMKVPKSEINAMLERITFWRASDLANLLPEEIRGQFEVKITNIKDKLPKDRLDTLNRIETLVSAVVLRLQALGVPQEDIDLVNDSSRGVYYCLINLLILEELFMSDFITANGLADKLEFIPTNFVAQKRLVQLMELGIAKRQFFRIGLANRQHYYFHTKGSLRLGDVLDPVLSKGLKFLQKYKYISEEVTVKDLRRMFGGHWPTTLRICSVLEEKKRLTIRDLTAVEGLENESSIRHGLYVLQKLELIDYYRLYTDADSQEVIYYLLSEYPNGLFLLDQISYLEPYQQKVLDEFLKKGVQIPNVRSFNDWLGNSWTVALKIYYLALTDDRLPKTDKNIKVLELKSLDTLMNMKRNSIYNALNILYNLGLLDQYPWFKKSYYFQLKGTEHTPLTKNPILPKEIQKLLIRIEQWAGIQFHNLAHMREILSRHWRASLKIYLIMLNDRDASQRRELSRQELIQLLTANNIILKRENTLRRYLKPLKEIGILTSYNKGQNTYYKLVDQ